MGATGNKKNMAGNSMMKYPQLLYVRKWNDVQQITNKKMLDNLTYIEGIILNNLLCCYQDLSEEENKFLLTCAAGYYVILYSSPSSL